MDVLCKKARSSSSERFHVKKSRSLHLEERESKCLRGARTRETRACLPAEYFVVREHFSRDALLPFEQDDVG